MLTVLVVVIVGALGGLALVGWVVSVASSAPPISALKPRDPGSSTVVYSADDQRLGFISGDELRQPARYERIPETMRNATVAIEDERFYRHKGVDYEGVVRAAVKNFASQRTVQGGSTISMQVVRNLYTEDKTRAGLAGYQRKIREAKLAEELENEHSKRWILSTYLNTVPYGTLGGQTAIGVKAAARMFFSKPVEKLTLRESALLAGLPQAPTDYSPIRSRGAAKTRRNEVLRKMAQLGMISRRTAERTMRRSLGVETSTYFSKRRESYFVDYVKDELLKEYGAQTVRNGGMRVYTTIDLKKQQEARTAISNKLAGAGPSSAIVTIDPRNGYIKAMASSADYGQSKYNLAAQGHRQPGSTFKVMALMAALREGVDPDRTHYVSRSPTVISNTPWGPINVKTYGGRGAGDLSLRRATLKSDNSVYIQLALDLGPDKVAQAAHDLGIRSKLQGLPAETLGGLGDGVSPLEMANAYATIASGGMRNRPTAIRKIAFPGGRVDKGKSMPQRFRVKRKRAFSDGATAKATDILEQNIQSGTGTNAKLNCPAAGKTGTTDNNTDAWFVGFTPRLATAVWVGYPKQQAYMNTEYHGGPVDGGTFPAEIWGEYMSAAKGGFCGDFKAPRQAFAAKPFDGGSGSGGPNGNGNSGSLVPGTGTAPAPAPAQPQAPSGDGDQGGDGNAGGGRRDGGGGGNRGGGGGNGGGGSGGGGGGDGGGDGGGAGAGANGGTEFDPGSYDSP